MKSKQQIDIWLLTPVFVLIAISLTTLFSINVAFFKSQLISFVVGVVVFFLISKINIDFLRQLKLPIYLASLALLSIILFIGIETRGAVRWIDILGVRLQFSEILKPFLALIFAQQITDTKSHGIRSFFINIALILPVFLLIFMQPDLGTGLVYLFVAFFALFITGFPLIWFLFLIIPLMFASPFFWLLLHDFQRDRVLTFFHATKDPLGTSYNAIQAIIAVGSGSFFGKGISEGTQSVLKFLPERHTDFIFATIAEGLGFFGASIVIIAFLFLVYRIYVLYKDTTDLFEKTFLSMSFGFLLIQGFVNIAMNIGLLPIVGITLPFVSFGGNSLLSNFIFLGLISSLVSSQKYK